MKKIFAVLALVGVVATGVAQNISKAGLYDKKGAAVKVEADPVVVNVTLRVAVEQFTPGKYARYAQKYLGAEVTYSSKTSIKLVDARLALGAAEKPMPVVAAPAEELPLPLNIFNKNLSEAEQAAATVKLIFSLRQHRLELITGEAGENVFGAGLKAALDEIAYMEKECLAMFYGKTTVTEEVYSFNVAVTPDKSEYAVCRFNSEKGVVEANDLSGKPIVLKVESAEYKDYSELIEGKSKGLFSNSKEYHIVPQSKCLLIGETTLLDTLDFASILFAKSVKAAPVK